MIFQREELSGEISNSDSLIVNLNEYKTPVPGKEFPVVQEFLL